MADVLEIGGEVILRNTRADLELPVARLPTGDELTMPVRVRRGKRQGPRLFVSAAVHGDEVNGVEVLRRLLLHPRVQRLRGTLIAVPVVNVFGFNARSRYLPDRRDLNRCFPGSETGSLASRLAHLFMKEVVANSTHGIDLHTASHHRTNLPQIRVTTGDAEARRLADVFGAPVVLEAALREGSMRGEVAKRGIPLLVYEGGEALRFDEWAIRAGVRGVLAVMEEIGMVAPRKRRRPRPVPLGARSSTWVRAATSGSFLPAVRLGATVEKGEILGTVVTPLGDVEREVPSTAHGVVIGRTLLPLVSEGDALFHVARLGDAAEDADPLEDYGVDLQLPFLVETDGGGT